MDDQLPFIGNPDFFDPGRRGPTTTAKQEMSIAHDWQPPQITYRLGQPFRYRLKSELWYYAPIRAHLRDSPAMARPGFMVLQSAPGVGLTGAGTRPAAILGCSF